MSSFRHIFSMGGASWTLDPSREALNCKIKLAKNKFILVNILTYNNFIWTKKGVIINVEIWIIKTYYSLLKSHSAFQICTVSYVEYCISKIPKKLYLAERLVRKSVHCKYCNFLNNKLRHGYASVNFTKFSEHSCLYSITYFVSE